MLILDEPTVGLDPKQIIEVRELIKRLGGKHTVILSTHILPEVSMTCHRVVIINKGRIVAIDTPENLTSQLRGGARIELEVRGPVDTLPVTLAAIPHVKNVLVGTPQAQDGHHRVSVDVDGTQDVRHLIARRLLDSGFELYGLRAQTMTLSHFNL